MNFHEAVRQQITRRWFFQQCGVGLGAMALAALLEADRASAAAVGPADPLAPKQPHFAAKAKRVIFLFLAGAPSHLDLFDYKPQLEKYGGQLPPAELLKGYRAAFINPQLEAARRRSSSSPSMASPGPSCRSCCRTWPTVVDDIAIVQLDGHRRVQPRAGPDLDEHRLAAVRPAEHRRLGDLWPGQRGAGPARLRRLQHSAKKGTSGGASNWGSGFLPTVYQGVPFRSQGDPVLYLSNPPGIDRQAQRDSLDALEPAQRHAARRGGRSGNRHADQLVRDGLPHADQRAGADGHFRASRRRRSTCTAPSRASRRSPTTACSPGGWSSAACGSCSCFTRPGTSTAA